MKKLFILSILTLSGLCHTSAKEMFYEIKSPDKRICFSVKTDSGQQPAYKISVDGNDVIDWSALGFSYGETNAFSSAEIKPRSMRPKKVNKVWRPLWGKRSAVKDAYNTWSFSIPIGADLLYGSSAKGPKTNATLEVRVYNEGAAFRVYMPTSRAIYMLNLEAARSLSREEMQIPIIESTEFNFAGDYTAWYYNGERHNIGPEKLSDAGGERLPIMTIRASDELYLALHEAHLDYDGWPMRLRTEAGSTKFNVIPEKIETNGLLFPGAWRVIMVGRTPGDLVDSHLIELLNPEPEMDFSWVRPGVYLWDWRIDGAVWEGYRYGM
ncbi:MAG: glycoside hydrolase family 97 N-terminal domain-containing protein, partial [Bacteroidaceae bacterium]